MLLGVPMTLGLDIPLFARLILAKPRFETRETLQAQLIPPCLMFDFSV